MTDILERLNTVVTHAEHGVDPYWVEIAAKEIDRLRTLINNFETAHVGDIECVCPYLDCVCEDDAYQAATKALLEAADSWNLEGELR
jgi:hypothetical protein